MARTKIERVDKWDNYHQNGPWPLKWLMSTQLSKDGTLSSLGKYLDAAEEVRRLIKEAYEAGERFRPFGSAWSLSNVAHQKDRMHHNASMNLKWALPSSLLDEKSSIDSKHLSFFQCGNIIKEVSAFLKTRGQSLPVSGASNGQTIAGAVSTGVHGAFIDQGGIQDSVVGLHLITGPNPEDVVYIERESVPAMSAKFAEVTGARLIRNDEIFNAALVGLGAFGFIHGIVLKSVDIFLLKRYTRKIQKKEALQLAENLDFANSSFKIEGEVDDQGKGLRPYYFICYINPYKEEEEIVAEIMYKKPYRPDYINPIPRVKNFQYKELTTWIGSYASKINVGLKGLLNLLKNSVFPDLDEEAEGTLADFFWDSSHKGDVFAVSLGINQPDIQRAYGVLKTLMRNRGPIPALLGIRFVKGTEATLGFTRFKQTCILEFAGVTWKESKKIISLYRFINLLLEELKAQEIEFTHHWGKNTNWDHPQLAEYMYGEDRIERWKTAREALLPLPMLYVFENEFLDQLELSGPSSKFQNQVA